MRQPIRIRSGRAPEISLTQENARPVNRTRSKQGYGEAGASLSRSKTDRCRGSRMEELDRQPYARASMRLAEAARLRAASARRHECRPREKGPRYARLSVVRSQCGLSFDLRGPAPPGMYRRHAMPTQR